MENQNMQQDSAYDQYQQHLNQPMTVGDWFITILITAIPLVGLIMLFVWAFGGNTNVNKANWAKATLLWALIAIILAFIIGAITGLAFLSAFNNGY